MSRGLLAILLATVLSVHGQEPEGKTGYGRPALIETTKLAEFETLPADRKKLIEGAIAVARDSPWLPYLFSYHGTPPGIAFRKE